MLDGTARCLRDGADTATIGDDADVMRGSDRSSRPRTPLWDRLEALAGGLQAFERGMLVPSSLIEAADQEAAIHRISEGVAVSPSAHGRLSPTGPRYLHSRLVRAVVRSYV